MKAMKKFMPDGQWDVGDGIVFDRQFSVGHLLFQNPLAQATDQELLFLLRGQIGRMPADPKREGPFCRAADLLADDEAAVDQTPLAQIIYQGNFYGMGASPLLPLETILLWAAAARLLCRVHVQHVNDMTTR